MSDFDVKLPDGKIIKQSLIRNSGDFQKTLLSYRTPGATYPLCLCRDDTENNLIIKKRGDTVFLSSWPGSGSFHNDKCQHYQEAPDTLTGISQITKGAKVEKAGRVYLSCNVTLTHRVKDENKLPKEAPQAAEPGQEQEEKDSVKQTRKIGLVELFYDFWMGAQLHQYSAGIEEKRTWSVIRSKLTAYTRNIYVNKIAMSEGLFIPYPFNPTEADKIDKFKEEFFKPWRGEKLKDLLVLGELKDIEPSEYGMTLKLRHESMPLYMSNEQFELLEKNYKFAMGVFADNQLAEKEIGKVMVTAACNMPSRYLTLKSISLVVTSREYIPVSNYSELKAIHEFVAQKRSFYRPAKFTNESIDTPDFVFVDTENVTVAGIYDCEVDDYDSHKENKTFFLKQLGYDIWKWLPGEEAAVPALPSKYEPSNSK